MHATGLLCAVRGHRWRPVPDSTEAYPLFECTRCRRRQEFAPGTQAAGYGARLEARTGLDKAVGPFGRRR